MAVDELATPQELRVWLDLAEDDTFNLPDARAQLLLDGVTSDVLAECNRTTFALVETTVRVDGSGTRELVLPVAPVTDVASVVEDPDGAAPTTLVVGTDVEWSDAGILRRLNGIFRRRFRWYETTVTHGYETTPEAVRNTVLRVAARAVSNPEGLATEGISAYNAGFAFDETRLPILSAPDRRALDPFRL